MPFGIVLARKKLKDVLNLFLICLTKIGKKLNKGFDDSILAMRTFARGWPFLMRVVVELTDKKWVNQLCKEVS